jgi:hypothetical protein
MILAALIRISRFRVRFTAAAIARRSIPPMSVDVTDASFVARIERKWTLSRWPANCGDGLWRIWHCDFNHCCRARFLGHLGPRDQILPTGGGRSHHNRDHTQQDPD